MNERSPSIYEDGEQTRDLGYVGDIARACLLAAPSDRLDGLAVNVGTGNPTSVRRLAESLADLLEKRIEPQVPGAFRPGEMPALTPYISLMAPACFQPTVALDAGLARSLEWLPHQDSLPAPFPQPPSALPTPPPLPPPR